MIGEGSVWLKETNYHKDGPAVGQALPKGLDDLHLGRFSRPKRTKPWAASPELSVGPALVGKPPEARV